MRSAGAQQAVQQEVEKLQVQNGAAAGLAPPKTEPGDVGARLGRELPPAKVSGSLFRDCFFPPKLRLPRQQLRARHCVRCRSCHPQHGKNPTF